MEAYIYNADIYCPRCAKLIQSDLAPTSDSDSYPQGPYANGGGDSDSPQHCARCLTFLENPLTVDGVAYVRELMSRSNPIHPSTALLEWADYYATELCHCSDVADDDSSGVCVPCFYRSTK